MACLADCDQAIYQTGVAVGCFGGGKATVIEAIVAQVREASGQPVDWHYVAGRAVVKTTGDPAKVRDALESLCPILRVL